MSSRVSSSGVISTAPTETFTTRHLRARDCIHSPPYASRLARSGDVEVEPVAEADEGAQQRPSHEDEDDRVAYAAQQVPPETGEKVVVPISAQRLSRTEARFVRDVGAGGEERPGPEVGDRTEEQTPEHPESNHHADLGLAAGLESRCEHSECAGAGAHPRAGEHLERQPRPEAAS